MQDLISLAIQSVAVRGSTVDHCAPPQSSHINKTANFECAATTKVLFGSPNAEWVGSPTPMRFVGGVPSSAEMWGTQPTAEEPTPPHPTDVHQVQSGQAHREQGLAPLSHAEPVVCCTSFLGSQESLICGMSSYLPRQSAVRMICWPAEWGPPSHFFNLAAQVLFCQLEPFRLQRRSRRRMPKEWKTVKQHCLFI